MKLRWKMSEKMSKIPEFEYIQKGIQLICNAKDRSKSFAMFISPVLVLRKQTKNGLVFENIQTKQEVETKFPHLGRK